MTPPQLPVLALVTDSIAPWHKGGKETRTLHYSTELANDFEVHLYTMKWWDGPTSVQQGDVVVHGICRRWDLYTGQRRSIWQAFAFSVACLRLLRAKFDVVEVDQIPILPLIAVKAVCVVRRKPLVATWHETWGRDYWREYLGWLGVGAAFAERFVARLPDRIIAGSDGAAAILRDLLGTNAHITVGLSGFDPAEITDAPPSSTSFDLLFVGRLLEHKGVDTLIRALATLSEHGEALSLGIVGHGPAAKPLNELVNELGIASCVTFTGELASHSEVLGQMKSSGVLVFPTRREGFGIVAVEAMACGLPVITTNHPDNFARNLVTPGRDGYLCAPDGHDLPELILRALAQRSQLSRGAIAKAANYTWESAVRQCLAAYQFGVSR